jgi:hypothetical protein
MNMLRPLLQVRMKEEDATTSQGNRKDRQIEMLQGKERETERERGKIAEPLKASPYRPKKNE